MGDRDIRGTFSSDRALLPLEKSRPLDFFPSRTTDLQSTLCPTSFCPNQNPHVPPFAPNLWKRRGNGASVSCVGQLQARSAEESLVAFGVS